MTVGKSELSVIYVIFEGTKRRTFHNIFKLYGPHQNMIDRYGIPISQMTMYLLLFK